MKKISAMLCAGVSLPEGCSAARGFGKGLQDVGEQLNGASTK